ncbi:MAG: hypothetical protein ABI068_15995, partial [Ktedonobacterales bacterium]
MNKHERTPATHITTITTIITLASHQIGGSPRTGRHASQAQQDNAASVAKVPRTMPPSAIMPSTL